MTEASDDAVKIKEDADEAMVTFHVKSSGDKKYTLSLPLSTTTIDLKNKLATEEYANVPAAAQRLIYSGRVLKDHDTLASHNVKEGNTMHLVKSAPSNQRQNPASQSSSAPPSSSPTSHQTPRVPENIAAGTGNNPLAGLTGARYAGFTQLPSASMFGTDGGMGAPPNPEQIIQQLQDPNFAQMMREALNNPQVIDLMIQQNPQLRAMGPQARQMLQSENFRRMMTDPEALRQMAQLQQMFGLGPLAGQGGGQEAFPAPGTTTTTEPQNRESPNTQNRTQQTQQQNPFGAMGGLGANPFANLFNPNATGQTQGNTNGSQQPASGTSPTSQNPSNPFAALFNPAMFGAPQQGANPSSQPPANPFFGQITPEMMQQAMQILGGGQTPEQGGGNSTYGNFANLFGEGALEPADNRPPEERYATQLGQLNSMGFYDFDRNVQALRRSGGNVNGAVDWLLNNPT